MLIVDNIDNKYTIFTDRNISEFILLEVETKKIKKLQIKIDKRDGEKFIRYTYSSGGKRIEYRKKIILIKLKLFGIWEKGNKQLIGLNDDDCKRIILNHFNECGYLLPYSQMRSYDNELIRKVHLYIERHGGLRKYINLTSLLNIDNVIYYQDFDGRLLKSSLEFKFFSILHFNKVDYKYEPFRVERFIPDFYIPSKNLIVEILGMMNRKSYNKKSLEKEIVYKKNNFNYHPINVGTHNSTENLIQGIREIFGNISIPNFDEYFRKYSINGNQFLIKLKEILTQINNGNLKIDDENNLKGFVQLYRSYYDYAIQNYGSVFNSIKYIVGYPSVHIQRTKGYWDLIENCKYELEEIYKNEKYIPNVGQSQDEFGKKYILRQFYSKWGINSVLEGGVFFEFIEQLKIKYGYRNISEEKKQKIEDQVFNIVLKVYKGELKHTIGINSLEKKYGWVNDYLYKNYGSLFQFIKSKIGYPPPHIIRPKGYYEDELNVKYELEENWKKYKRLLNFSEIKYEKGKENTFNSLYSIIGIEQFREGGKYADFIENLKLKHGYDNIQLISEAEFQNNVIIYLNGLNEGKWNSNTHFTSELGILRKYFWYVVKKYGSIFDGIKTEIGFPHPRVGRPNGYYDVVDNCKYEIINNIKLHGRLIKYRE